jgi:hypothetical protein
METKSKMAAIAAVLDERWRWSLKGTFLQLPPTSHQKITPVDPGVGEKIKETKSKMAGEAAILDDLR